MHLVFQWAPYTYSEYRSRVQHAYSTTTTARVLVGHVAHIYLVGIDHVSSAHARAAPRARTP